MSQKLKIFTDTHIPLAMIKQMRLHGVDVERCEDVGMRTAKDEDLLIYATANHRAILSFDTDFDVLHKQWLEAGKDHCGIFRCQSYVQGPDKIGIVVKFISTHAELIEGEVGTLEKDVYNNLIYVP